jgi:hypothetical protein
MLQYELYFSETYKLLGGDIKESNCVNLKYDGEKDVFFKILYLVFCAN